MVKMSENLTNWLQEYNNMEDKRVVWELIKYHIRNFTMTYSSIKKLDTQKREKDLQNRLSSLEENLKNMDNVIEEYENIKTKLKGMETEQFKGMILRSKDNLWRNEKKVPNIFIVWKKITITRSTFGR